MENREGKMQISKLRLIKGIISLMLFLGILAFVLTVVTAIYAKRSGIDVIKTQYGTVDLKEKVFTPEIDDKTMYDILTSKGGIDVRNARIKYSDIFQNTDKSLKHYTAKTIGDSSKEECCFYVSRSLKKIRFTLKFKMTFSKKSKVYDLNVDWSKVIFGEDEKGKEILAVSKKRLKQEEPTKMFSLFEESYEYRQKLNLPRMKSFEGIDLAIYKGEPFIAKNDIITRFDVDKVLIAEYIDKIVNAINFVHKVNPKNGKYPIRLYINEDSKTRLAAFSEVEEGGTYEIPDEYRQECDDWYAYNDNTTPVFDDKFKVKENKILDVQSAKYVYGISKKSNQKRKITLVHKFENGEDSYDRDLITLKYKNDIVFTRAESTIGVEQYDLFSDKFDKYKYQPTVGFEKKKIGYTLNKVTLRRTGEPTEQEVDKSEFTVNKEDDHLELTFYYKRADVKVEVHDDNDRVIENPEKYGINKKTYKFGDKIFIRDYLADAKHIFKYWNTESGAVKNIVEQGTVTLDEKVFGGHRVIFRPQLEKFEGSEKPVSLTVQYMSQNENGDYFPIGEYKYRTKIIRNYKNTEVVPKEKYYEGIPEPEDAFDGYRIFDITNPSVPEEILDESTNNGIKITRTGHMDIAVRYNRKYTNLKFMKSKPDGENDYIDDEKFKGLFEDTAKWYYNTGLPTKVRARNEYTGVEKEIIQTGVKSVFKRWVVKDSSGNYVEFDLSSINRKHLSELEVYAEWTQKTVIDVNLKFMNEDGNTYGSEISFKSFVTDEYKVNGKLPVTDQGLRSYIRRYWNDVYRKAHEEFATFDQIFDLEKVIKAINNESEITLGANNKNIVALEVPRKKATVEIEQDFMSDIGNVSSNIEALRERFGKPDFNLSDDEKKGIGLLGYNYPSGLTQTVEIFRKNDGRYVFNYGKYAKNKYNKLTIGLENNDTTSHYVIDKVIINGEIKSYTKDAEFVENSEINTIRITYKYKPNTFILEVSKGMSDGNGKIKLNNNNKNQVTHMDEIILNDPEHTETNNNGDAKYEFDTWVYQKDGSKISDELLKRIPGQKTRRFIMPASNVKIKAKWREAVTARVSVNLVFEDVNGNYVASEHFAQVIGSHNGNWVSGEKVALKEYTNTDNNPVTHTKLKGFDFDWERTKKDRKVKEEGSEYNYYVDDIGNIDIKLYFKRKVTRAEYINNYAHLGSVSSVPASEGNIKYEAGLTNTDVTMSDLRHNDGGVSKFRGWSLTPDGEIVDLNAFRADKEEYFESGNTIKFYARWHAIELPIIAEVKFENDKGNFVNGQSFIGSNQLELGRVYVAFDGQEGSKIKPNSLRGEIYNKIIDKTPFVEDKNKITYVGGYGDEGVEVTQDASTRKFTYHVYRKKGKLKFVMPNGAEPATIADIEVRYGAKLLNVPEAERYSRSDWGTAFAKFKYWTNEKPLNNNDFIQNAAEFVLKDHALIEPELFNGDKAITLYPVWKSVENIETKVNVNVEKAEYTSQAERWEQFDEFKSSQTLSENDKINKQTFFNEVKSKLTNIYDSTISTVELIYNGEVINDGTDIDVQFPSMEVEYRVKRKKSIIELDTSKTPTNIPNVTIPNTGNKKLQYRIGQKPNHEVPVIDGDESNEFVGWETESEVEFKFDGTKPLNTEMLKLKPKFRVTRKTVNIDTSEIGADSIDYPEEDGVKVKKESNNIKVHIAVNKLPYRLKPLSVSGIVYNKTTHEPAKINGYSESEIVGHANVTVTHIPDREKYRGYYPQGKVNKPELNQAILTTHSQSLSLNNNTQWVVAYLKGVKYEKVNDLYFKYELVELEESPLYDHKKEMWSKKKIDMSIYHELGDAHNVYERSYIREYIEIVMHKKMALRKNDKVYLSKIKGFTSGALVNIKHNITKVDKYAIINVENTNYTVEVKKQYSQMRGIPKTKYTEVDYNIVWTATHALKGNFSIEPDKTVWVFNSQRLLELDVNNVYTIRPVIEFET